MAKSVSCVAGTYEITAADLGAGPWGTTLHTISRVYYTNTDGEEVPLTYKAFDALLAKYPEFGNSDQDEPAYWTVGVWPLYLTADTPTEAQKGQYRTERLYIMPPLDDTYTVSVYGKGIDYSLSNSTTTNTNYWTVYHPDLLIAACIWYIKQEYEDKESMTHWKVIMDMYILDIEREQIMREATKSTGVMGG